MSIFAALVASLTIASSGLDAKEATASFVAAVHNVPPPLVDEWRADPWMQGTVAVVAGEWGRAIVRESDRKVVSWSKYHPARPGHKRTQPATSYLSESDVREQTALILDRLQRTDLEIEAVLLSKDTVDVAGELTRGIARIRMRFPTSPRLVGSLRKGAMLSLDAATGEPRSFREIDNVTAVRGTDTLTQEEALRIADQHVRAEWKKDTFSRTGFSSGYAISIQEIAEAYEQRKPDPLLVGPISAYWCLCATYDDPSGAWVCVRMSDGVVISDGLVPQ